MNRGSWGLDSDKRERHVVRPMEKIEQPFISKTEKYYVLRDSYIRSERPAKRDQPNLSAVTAELIRFGFATPQKRGPGGVRLE